MKTVIGILLSFLVTSGGWYFYKTGIPEHGPMVLVCISWMMCTVCLMIIFVNSVLDNW